jgi:hypothetical protein
LSRPPSVAAVLKAVEQLRAKVESVVVVPSDLSTEEQVVIADLVAGAIEVAVRAEEAVAVLKAEVQQLRVKVEQQLCSRRRCISLGRRWSNSCAPGGGGAAPSLTAARRGAVLSISSFARSWTLFPPPSIPFPPPHASRDN